MTGATGNKLIFAGTRKEYVDYLHSRYIYQTQFSEQSGHYDGLLHNATAGMHFDEIVIVGTFRSLADARKILGLARHALTPNGKVRYADLPEGWYISAWDLNGDSMIKDASGKLRCNWCRDKVTETYRGGLCSACKMGKNSQPMLTPKSLLPIPTHALKLLPLKSGGQVTHFGGLVSGEKITLKHKEGDIWSIPQSTSPMWTKQWGYQGSAKTPYIVSLKSTEVGKANNNTTSDGWACSCMNFTRHTPRTPCKHILNVMLMQGVNVKKSATKLANVDDKKMAEFEAWQRDRVAAKADKKPGDAKLALFGQTARKFR